MVARGCVWLLGACVVAEGCMVAGGACMVAGEGGMCGCWGVCMVAGGHTWLPGGMCGCQEGAYMGYDEIRSMSGRYASYWNAFLFMLKICS